MDRSWNRGVQGYMSNCGRVVQNLKKVRDAVDL